MKKINIRKVLNFAIPIFLILGTSKIVIAQSCETGIIPFSSGEELKYAVSYNWFVIWTDVGEVKIKLNNSELFGKKVLHIDATGNTYKGWDAFFKVRDRYQSWIDPNTLLPVFFDRKVNEGDYKIDQQDSYNWPKMEVYTKRSTNNKPYKYDTIGIKKCTFDLISILYYARTIDFNSYAVGSVIPVSIFLDGEINNLSFKYLGKENMKTKDLGTFRCIKFAVQVIAGDVFTGEEQLLIYATDDENKIPVYAESPIIIGNVKVRLLDYKGLKYPLTSLVK